MVIGETLVHFM